MDIETYYDFLTETPRSFSVLLTMAPSLIGTAVFIRQAIKAEAKALWVFLSIGSASVFVTVGWLEISMNLEARKLRHHLELGLVHKTEGEIYRYEELPTGRRGTEYLYIEGMRFEISESRAWAGFGRQVKNGSKLRQNQWVQIYHLDGHILRINIKSRKSQQNQDRSVPK